MFDITVYMMGYSKEKINEERMEYAIHELAKKGYDVHFRDKKSIKFMIGSNECTFFPFTGWATGKGIKDGRGINNLLKQL